MTRFDEWLAELERANMKRIRDSNPNMIFFDFQLMIGSCVEVHEKKNYKLIFIGGINRFIIWNKDNQIYESRNGVINKKKCYGQVDKFEEFSWETYYPTRKSLYDWKTKPEEKPSKKQRKTTSRLVVEDIKNSQWPYTRGTGEANRIHGAINQDLGESRTTQTNEPTTPNNKGDRTSNQSRKKRPR